MNANMSLKKILIRTIVKIIKLKFIEKNVQKKIYQYF